MRKRKVTNTVLGVIGILIIAALLLVPATQARAKSEKVEGKSFTQITRIHVIKVGDVDGHVIGAFERRGLGFINGEVTTYLNRGMFDYTKGNGTAEGYVTYTYEDGSTTVAKWQGTVAPTKDNRSTGKGTYTHIGGSGRFEGIKGGGSWTTMRYTPYTAEETKSDVIVNFTGTHTLPKK